MRTRAIGLARERKDFNGKWGFAAFLDFFVLSFVLYASINEPAGAHVRK